MITYFHSVSYIKNSNSLVFALAKDPVMLYLYITFSSKILKHQVHAVDEQQVAEELADGDADERDEQVGPHEAQQDGDGAA